MTDILIRGIDSKTVQRLKSRAKRGGRSLQRELTQILRQAAGGSIAESLSAGRKWRTSLGRTFDDSTELIKKDRAR